MRSDSMFVEAAKEDVPEIIALRHQIWGTTYRGIYPDDMIDNFDWAGIRRKNCCGSMIRRILCICSKKTIKISVI